MSERNNSWKLVAMLCATATAGYICRVNVSTAAPLLMEEFGLTQIQMGRIFSSFLLGYALFQVPSGALADKFGARKVLMWASALWFLLTLIQVFVGIGIFQFSVISALTLFMVLRMVLGITASPTYPGSAQGVSRWVPRAMQGRANGIVIASIGLGSAIAPPLVSGIMVNTGWRLALVISAVPAILITILWFWVNPGIAQTQDRSALRDAGPQEPDPDRGWLRKPGFWLLTLSYTLQGYVGYIFVTWFYLYLVQERHFGLLSGAWMSSLPWILSIVSIPLGGYISDRLARGRAGEKWGSRIVPMTGMLTSGVLISVGAHTGNAVLAAICLAFATAFILSVEGPFWAMMMRLSGNRSGTGGGIMNMGSNIGGLISPALTPVIASLLGWENALHVAAVLAVAGGLLWIWIRREYPQTQSNPE